MPYSKDFCKTCNRLRVSAPGKLHLCLFSENGIDMRHLLATGNVDEVVAFLQDVLGQKHETHYLHEGKTGATKHLCHAGRLVNWLYVKGKCRAK